MLLSTVQAHDLDVLFILLVVIAFAVAIWRASLSDIVGALVATLIAVCIAVLTL